MIILRTIRKIVTQAIRLHMQGVHTSGPAQIVSYDNETLCSIQLCVRPLLLDDVEGDGADMPVIEDIPVVIPGTANVLLSLPLAVGDYGMYVAAEDDISQWISEGGTVSPNSVHKFDLSDGFFVPGVYPLKNKISGAVAADRISIRTASGNTEISVLTGETLIIKNASGKIEMLSSGQVNINDSMTVDP